MPELESLLYAPKECLPITIAPPTPNGRRQTFFVYPGGEDFNFAARNLHWPANAARN
jgi:hypothetical protein